MPIIEDENSIISYNEQSNLPSFEEFKKFILNGENGNNTFVDELSDTYSKIPNIFRKLTSFDPTGIASYFDALLSDNKAQREQDRIIYAIYTMCDAITKHRKQLREHIEKDKIMYCNITELYLEKSKESIQEEKIGYYNRVWLNGILQSERQFTEKEYIFQLISNLTIDQILIIRTVYDNVKIKIKNIGQATEDETGICVSVEEISLQLNLNVPYVQQMCTDLHGRGLLRYPKGALINSEPSHFLFTSIVDLIDTYIQEPDSV